LGTGGNTYRLSEHYKFQKKCQSPNLRCDTFSFPDIGLKKDRQVRSQDISTPRGKRNSQAQSVGSGEIVAGQRGARGSLFATL
jgi:hypothetical protein